MINKKYIFKDTLLCGHNIQVNTIETNLKSTLELAKFLYEDCTIYKHDNDMLFFRSPGKYIIIYIEHYNKDICSEINCPIEETKTTVLDIYKKMM